MYGLRSWPEIRPSPAIYHVIDGTWGPTYHRRGGWFYLEDGFSREIVANVDNSLQDHKDNSK
jgi:hypothetical protein